MTTIDRIGDAVRVTDQAEQPPSPVSAMIKLAIIAVTAWLFWKAVSFIWKAGRIALGVALYAFFFLTFWAGIISAIIEGKPGYAIAALVCFPGCWLAMWISGLFKGRWKGALADA